MNATLTAAPEQARLREALADAHEAVAALTGHRPRCEAIARFLDQGPDTAAMRAELREVAGFLTAEAPRTSRLVVAGIRATLAAT